MKIERLTLLAALETIKPALASKDLIEELTHVWFDGKHAMAYNDAELGIQVRFESEFRGGLRGALLLGLLHNSRAREVTLEEGEAKGTMLLKAARTRATLSIFGLERSVWAFPASDKAKAFRLSGEFLEGIKAVLISVGKDTTHPETLGVTLYIDEGVSLFATDTQTIALVSLKKLPRDLQDKPITKRVDHVILPTAFCEQLLKLNQESAFIELRSDCALAGDDSGIRVYARLHHTERPLKLWDIVESFDKYSKEAKFEVPDRLALALDRIGVLFEGLHGEGVRVTISEGHLRLHAKVEGRGEIKDSVDVPYEVPEVEFTADPVLLKRALPFVTHMVCAEQGIRMNGPGGFLYLASHAM